MVRCLPSHVQKPLTNYVKKKNSIINNNMKNNNMERIFKRSQKNKESYFGAELYAWPLMFSQPSMLLQR